MKNKCYLIYHQETNYLATYIGPNVLGEIHVFDTNDTFATYGFEYLPYFGWEVIGEL